MIAASTRSGHALGNHTHLATMQTDIDIYDALLAEAIAATGQSTKRATVEQALVP